MNTRRLTLVCLSGIMLTAASAHAQLSPGTAPGAPPRGTVGMSSDRPGTIHSALRSRWDGMEAGRLRPALPMTLRYGRRTARWTGR
jgi:hypothetical protein